MRASKIFFFVIAIVAFLPIRASASETVNISVEFLTPILPVAHGVMQEIRIRLDSPELKSGDEVEATVTAESGYGVLMLKDAPTSAGNLDIRAGETTLLQYRWSGALPTDSPVTETITVFVQNLGLVASAEFSVGVDLQLMELSLPKDVKSGVFSSVSVWMSDRFHPEAPLDSILQKLGVNPELRFSLVADSPAANSDPAMERIVFGFLGENGRASADASYPDEKFEPGILRGGDSGESGEFFWTGVDGRAPGVVAPAPGAYRLTASLKPNTGGVAVKELTTTFEAVGDMPIASEMPGLFRATIEILDRLGAPEIETIARDVREKLRENDESAAAAILGQTFKTAPGVSGPSSFARFVNAILAAETGVDSVAPFIRHFLSGYGNTGILIITKSGVKKWITSIPVETSASSEQFVIITFGTDKNFVLNVEGSGTGATTIWKIVPQGINKKEYASGEWEKEITVHTERITPP
ncbi:MAG: hypothetical protein LBT31_03165 [Synergistaceae bacterium]|jgi:hypothetical protein|nr:hypothetical protein [Synergistaceae bacterium]